MLLTSMSGKSKGHFAWLHIGDGTFCMAPHRGYQGATIGQKTVARPDLSLTPSTLNATQLVAIYTDKTCLLKFPMQPLWYISN